MYTYNSTDGWKSFARPPKETLPLGSCLVAANGGSQMVLFGGYSATTNTTLGDIYILDVATSTWRMGPSAPISDRRRTPACAISNGYFIAWGGGAEVGNEVVAPANVTIVYDLRTDSWTTEYVATSGTTHVGEGPVSKVAIVSAIVASVIVVVLIVGGVVIYRRRFRRPGPSTMSPLPCTPNTLPVLPPKSKAKNTQYKTDKLSAAIVAGRVEEKRKGTGGIGRGMDPADAVGSRPLYQRPPSCAKVVESKGMVYDVAPPVYSSLHLYSSSEQPAVMEMEGTVTEVIRLYIDE